MLPVSGVGSLRPMKPRTKQYQNRVELLQGTLDMLILKTLQWGQQHGYGIVQALRTQSAEVLQVETGSLYPALHRMERQGWVRSEWKQTESKQRARYYRITASGKKQLASDLGRWEQLVTAIGAVTRGRPDEGET
jgi:PadR family transcriptional regulator, regulatory protein PadR